MSTIPSPLVEPDVQISRIRLTPRLSPQAFAGCAAARQSRRQPVVEGLQPPRISAGEYHFRLTPTSGALECMLVGLRRSPVSVLPRLIISNDDRDCWRPRLSNIRRDGTLAAQRFIKFTLPSKFKIPIIRR